MKVLPSKRDIYGKLLNAETYVNADSVVSFRVEPIIVVSKEPSAENSRKTVSWVGILPWTTVL